MPTRARNFIVYLGDTFSRRVNLVPGPDSDLDGWTGEFIVFADDDTAILSATTANGRLTCNNGYIEIDVAAATTAAIETDGLSRSGTRFEPANNDEIPYSGEGSIARYYLRVTSPAGVITRLLDGDVVIVG